MANRASSGGLFPPGSWRPGDGAQAPDKGLPATGSATRPVLQNSFAGQLRPRHDTQAGDPVIKDKVNRRNVKNSGERNGPAGIVSCSRTYSDPSFTDTGRQVRIMPSAHGNGDRPKSRDGG